MVLNGLGCINQVLNDGALGRALDTLYDYGVTELYSLITPTAAKCLGPSPTSLYLDNVSFHADERYNRDEPPSEPVVHMTKSYSRDHRPDVNQVMLELIIEHQAGIPVLMRPLSGNGSNPRACGQVIQAYIDPLQITYEATVMVAGSALPRGQSPSSSPYSD